MTARHELPLFDATQFLELVKQSNGSLWPLLGLTDQVDEALVAQVENFDFAIISSGQ
ncbi:unnamed protein product [Ilex paraguariensis]|uniref:Uncharacterized protein n=1 Tax=Ilex paraguariensis TaxID=185542 RepID=A0ABC8TAX9_9AQUA